MPESISIGDYDVKRVTQELAVDQSEGVGCLQLMRGRVNREKQELHPHSPEKIHLCIKNLTFIYI